MEQTSQYQFSQWAATDRIQMADFNADNLKTEQALSALAAQTAQIANCGNCQLYTTTYTGNGSTTAKSVTFPAKPVVVMISDAYGICRTLFWQGMPSSPYLHSSYDGMTLTWNGNTVSWQQSNAENMFNRSGITYYLAALLNLDA